MPNDPMHVVKRGGKYCVMGVSAKGSPGKGRCFSSKKQAVKQMQAINLSMMRKGTLKPKGGKSAAAKKGKK